MFRRITQSICPFIQERPVYLARISKEDDLRIFSCPGNNSFYLGGRHVLRFIYDQISLYNRSSSDEVHSFCLNDPPLKDFFYFPGQFRLAAVPFLFIGIYQLFQIIDHRAQKRGNLLLLIARQKTYFRIKLRVWPADQNPPVLPGIVVQHFLQSYSQRIKSLAGPGNPLDDHQRAPFPLAASTLPG